MKQRIVRNVSVLVLTAVLLTFLATSVVMYEKYKETIRQGIYNEAGYLSISVNQMGPEFLTKQVGDLTSSRITLIDQNGVVLFDSEEALQNLENHNNRPELQMAREKGYGVSERYSETLDEQTFYYALLLEDGMILRVASTTDSVFATMFDGLALLILVLVFVLVFSIYLISIQTNHLIRPINELDLEQPLNHIEYEEMRPLMLRLDNQNRQIAQQMEELKKAGEVRREFSANVSHELKTPLMSISGYAEITKNGMVQQKDMTEFAGRIYQEATRLTTLVEDIISLSKLDENSSQMPFETVDIEALTKDVLENLEHYAKKQSIVLYLTGISQVSVRGVYHILYEMFYNLVDNAIKYSNEGGKVHVHIRKMAGQVFWSVEDEGIGIAKEDQERIFERFYRVDKSHSRETGGTGLGLSIVKHGAMLHEAEIHLDSEVGKGTFIELTFSDAI